MAHSIDTRLLTCRYWALGPGCPNVDMHGIEICDFAHRDTGVLAGSHLQRGTCRGWLSGGCYYGNACNYEHRHTGVFGLWQGVLPLSGPDFAIANRAFASGFNTSDHEALMNLIWSTKRVDMHNSNPHKGDRPPIHPIYPDRYRPCGVGDNTGRERPVCSEKPSVPVTDSPPPFHPIRPLGFGKKKRKSNKKKKKSKNKGGNGNAGDVPVNKNGLDRVLGSARISKPNSKKTNPRKSGSQSNPIDLPSDSEDESRTEHAATRLQNVKQLQPPLGQCKLENPVENHVTDMVSEQGIPEFDTIPNNGVNTTLEITSVLHSVKARLEHLRKSMAETKTSMSSLFSRNAECLGSNELFPIMNNVAQEIYRCHDAARDAAVEVDRAVGQLEVEDAIGVGATKEEVL